MVNNKVRQTEEMLRQRAIDQASDQINNIHNRLVVEKINAKLPEEIFVNYFLPYFSGLVPITKGSDVIANWIGISGTAMAEVDVIDVNGNTLFTVPALFDTDIINITKYAKGESLEDIYSKHNLYMNNLPVIANKKLNDDLFIKSESVIKSSSNYDDNTIRWSNIFKRYNLLKENASTNKNITHIDNSDDLEYG